MKQNKLLIFIIILLMSMCFTACEQINVQSPLLFFQDVVQWRESESLSAEIAGPMKVGQSIASDCNDLCRIHVLIVKTKSSAPTNLHWYIKPSLNSENIVASGSIAVSSMPSRGSLKLIFPPINNKEKSTIYFYLENPEAKPGQGIYATYSSKRYTHSRIIGNRYENGQLQDGNLTFITFCAFGQTPAEIFKEITNRFTGSKMFSIVYFSIILLLITAMYFCEKGISSKK